MELFLCSTDLIQNILLSLPVHAIMVKSQALLILVSVPVFDHKAQQARQNSAKQNDFYAVWCALGPNSGALTYVNKA